jgi:DNA adenine methylase
MEKELPRVGPILKWAGGKTKLLNEVTRHFPKAFRDYHEPFLGGAAVFLGTKPERAVLYDTNEQLINLYVTASRMPSQLLEAIQKLETEFNRLEPEDRRQWHVRIRAEFNEATSDDLRSASLFLALNKTSFNGLYRVNSRGDFNVPFNQAKGKVSFVNPLNFLSAAELFARSDLLVGDFERVLGESGDGSLVYFDPPYVPLSATSSFTGYDKSGFGLEDHLRLVNTARQLRSRGATVVISNSSAPWVLETYADAGFQLNRVEIQRRIGANSASRKAVAEVIAVA